MTAEKLIYTFYLTNPTSYGKIQDLPRSVQTKFRRKAGIHLFAIDLDKNMAEYLVKFMCST